MTPTTLHPESVESVSTDAKDGALTVLIADKFPREGLERLETLGCRAEFQPDLKTDDLPHVVRDMDPDVLVVRSTKVPRTVFESAETLSLVIRAGAGYDTIDTDAASDRGVFVCNCPGTNSTAVAELVMGLLVSADRHIPDQSADLRRHVWDKKGYSSKARGLKGRTLGIVGVGQIGRLVAERALAFEMYVLYHDIVPCPELDGHEHVKKVSLEEVLSNADFVSLHVPANEGTRHLINEKTLALMQPDALLVNTTRGSVVDEKALVTALRDGQIAGAAMDVYENEPAATDREITNELLDLPNFIGTHHVGASTEQAQASVAAEVGRIIDEYARSGKPLHCVNLAGTTPATSLLTVRYRNETGVLAHIFDVLSDTGIHTEEMSSIIFSGATAACVRIQLDTTPTGGQLDRIRQNERIVSVGVSALP
jgi:D-3-phosphoglycerate dehydrogenase